MERKRILLSGATGNMGLEGLRLFRAHRDKFHLVILALPTGKDKKILRKFEEQARPNPFLAQVWYADHERNEDNEFV